MKNIIKLLPLIIFFNCYSKTYKLTNDPIDVVICCHEKDIRILDLAINGARKNIKNIRRVIVISERKLTDNAEWFDESRFPFSKSDVAKMIFKDNEEEYNKFLQSPRLGWITKQIFNLHAAFVIPNISSNILILDADTVFLNPIEFIDSKNNALYNPGTENHKCYFDHAKRLIAGKNQIKKVFKQYSGICHHMLFQKPVLEDLFKLIEDTHKMPAWKAICHCIDKNEVYRSAIAEYEIYFNFLFANTKQVKIRHLKWTNIIFNLDNFPKYQKLGYHFISSHHWMDPK